jgi:hypothetical protein
MVVGRCLVACNHPPLVLNRPWLTQPSRGLRLLSSPLSGAARIRVPQAVGPGRLAGDIVGQPASRPTFW